MTKLPSALPGGAYGLPPELRQDFGAKLARRVTYIISAAALSLVVWAAMSPIEEVALASGQLVPAQSMYQVQHLEGGIVDSVAVSEGSTVAQGQMLMILRPELAGSDFGQLRARAAHLAMKYIRLTALIDGKSPDFGAFSADYAAFVQDQLHAYAQARDQAEEETRQLQLTIRRLGEQLQSLGLEKRSLEQQIDLLAEQAAIRKRSHEMGYTSRNLLLQTQANLEEMRQRLHALNGRMAEQQSLLEEARVKLSETQAERLRKWSEERAEISAQQQEVEESISKLRDRVQRLEVKAPASGVIQHLAYKHPGEVVKPGAVIAQIVPSGGGLVAEVELQPRDIGHVREGIPAQLVLSNYDPNVVGMLGGRVETISPSTMEDKDGRLFYRVRIALERDHLTFHGQRAPLLPGMTLQAKLRTGSKSLLRYMLKPVYQSFDTAFSER
jgi:HlyD family secretion protein/adhesin transport system membrane fusion protein